MRWADIQAATALVQQVPLLSQATFVSTVPKPSVGATQPLPYAVIHPSGGTDEVTRETAPALTEHPAFTLHLVGGSAEQVAVLCDLLKPILTPDVHPTVTGRRTSRIWWREPLPIQEDTDVAPPLIFAVIEFGWRSDPS